MQTLNFARPGSRGRAASTMALFLALVAGAAGCSPIAISNADLTGHDYRLRHPVLISNEPEVLEIPVGMKGPALSRRIEAAIGDYVAGYRENGTGGMTIQVPTAAANSIAAASTGQAVHYALVRAGIPHGQITVAPYYFGDHARTASLRLSYLRVKAVTPKCGLRPETGPNRFDNAQLHNLGCANQQNLAAMVENPADLVRPRPMTPANGARRAKVISDYSQAAETRSETTLIDTGLGGSR